MTETEAEKLSIIKQMVDLNLSGYGYSDYQKAKALDVLFKTIRETSLYEDSKSTFSIASKRIKRFLEENAKKRSFTKNYIDDIDTFIALFKEYIQRPPWNGELKRVYRDRFKIRDSYLWYMDKLIHERSQAKKAREKRENENDD